MHLRMFPCSCYTSSSRNHNWRLKSSESKVKTWKNVNVQRELQGSVQKCVLWSIPFGQIIWLPYFFYNGGLVGATLRPGFPYRTLHRECTFSPDLNWGHPLISSRGVIQACNVKSKILRCHRTGIEGKSFNQDTCPGNICLSEVLSHFGQITSHFMLGMMVIWKVKWRLKSPVTLRSFPLIYYFFSWTES